VLITSITGCCKAEKELGSGYFNPFTNPKARSLLIVLLQNISGSVVSLKTKSLSRQKGFVVRCCPDVGYQTHNPTKELRQLYDRTVRLQSADLALRRMEI